MLGVLVNAVAALVGGIIGVLIKKGFPERISDSIMKAVGLSVLYIGVTGIIGTVPETVNGGKFTLVLIISMVVGTLVGSLIKIQERFATFTENIEKKFKKDNGKVNLAEGFISASLLFCVGAMTIVGSLEAGIQGDNSTLFAKSLLDFISAIILASSLGIGVAFSSVFVLVFQGAIALLGSYIQPILTDYSIAMISTVGSLLIIALSLNMLGITKFKVMNFMPAVFLPLIFCLV